MNGMTTKEAAEKWGVTLRKMQLLCATGRIPGAVRFHNAWVIPEPQDGRVDENSKK